MKFRISKPIIDKNEFVPKREITFDLNVEQIVDIANMVDEDRMYELVGEAVKQDFIKFMKNDVKREFEREFYVAPDSVKEKMDNIDKELFMKNSMPNPIPKKKEGLVIDNYDIFRGKNTKWHLRWDYFGWKRDSYSETPYTQEEWNCSLATRVNQISAQIHMSTYCSGNHVITHYDNMRLLEKLDYFKITPEGDYQLGRHRVLFTDKIETKNKLFVFSERLMDLKAMPLKKVEKAEEMDEVSFMSLDYFHSDEIKEYKKKLLGSITIDNYEKFQEEYGQ
jgi:hypothetical protein